MYELYPYFTNDGSVGLFSPLDDDIYHSTYGALTEAYEKFILPANFDKYFSKHNEIKILDICFGIGYNTKSFLNYFLENILTEKKSLKKHCIAPIDTDNIKYNDQIYTDNVNCKNSACKAERATNFIEEKCNNKKQCEENFQKKKIYIKAVDTDKNLAFLSPFFVTGKTNIKNNKLSFQQEKIAKMLKSTKKSKFCLKDETNIILLLKILENHPEILEDPEISGLLNNKKYRRYFAPYLMGLFEFYKFKEGKYTPYMALKGFLHNIYYRYISNRQKKALNTLKLMDFNFSLKIEDARQSLLSDNNTYNFVFLDAFTPAKCPALWTVDFFKLLYSHLDENGMVLTYSNSASIRNAFINAGFYVGKIFNASAGKYMGTIAVKNRALVEHELSEYDLGLLKTKAGIFYRDENLTLENEAIIAAHKKEVENSTLMSSSKYIKSFKKH